jgi:hypothetical protein
VGVLHATPPDESFSVAGAEAWREEHTVSGGIAVFDDLTAGTDADTTMATQKSYVVDMTPWATADRPYTLTTDAVVGDRVSVSVLAGNASFELILKTGAGQTCSFSGSTIAALTEITRLFIAGEVMVFRYVAADKWMVEHDGRIAQKCMLESTNATSASHDTATKITLGTSVYDVGGIGNAANNRAAPRRAGKYLLSGMVNFASLAVDTRVTGFVYTGSSPAVYRYLGMSYNRIATTTLVVSGATSATLAVGDFVELWGAWDVVGGSGSKSTNVTNAGIKPFLSATEVL